MLKDKLPPCNWTLIQRGDFSSSFAEKRHLKWQQFPECADDDKIRYSRQCRGTRYAYQWVSLMKISLHIKPTPHCHWPPCIICSRAAFSLLTFRYFVLWFCCQQYDYTCHNVIAHKKTCLQKAQPLILTSEKIIEADLYTMIRIK